MATKNKIAFVHYGSGYVSYELQVENPLKFRGFKPFFTSLKIRGI